MATRENRTGLIISDMPGKLFIVATPIGNLEDITLRAIRILKEVDLIACEDTRQTRKLLAHYDISKPTISYHEHNERERAPELISRMESNHNVALVSDAGTPMVSDPGFHVVKMAIERGIPVVAVPGASALIAALSASGLPADQFLFAGFLPPKRTRRRARLAALKSLEATLVFYESPRRIRETLSDALDELGDRPAVIAREITKLHEEFIRGMLSAIELPASSERGEFVLMIGPASRSRPERKPGQPAHSINDEIQRIMRDEGIAQKEALKRVARERRISKSEAYRAMLAEKEKERSEQ
jgi:16S rRNA (cytidine1402-2'-O)-methyltransferase